MISHSGVFDSPQGSDLVYVRVDGASGTIAMNRKEKRNAITRDMLAQLRQAFEDLHQEKRVRAVILTGVGDAFSAGTDLVELHEGLQLEDPQQRWYVDSLAQKELVEYMLRFPKPIIAAVNGPALGMGAALVLASDFAVGTASVQFGFPETRRGLVSGIGAPLLAFRLSASIAADFLLRGQVVDGNECHRLGILRWLVAEELVWAKADAVAREISATAAEAVAMTKRLLNESVGEQLLTQMSAGAAATATARTTQNAVEGITAFVEKREPKWQ